MFSNTNTFVLGIPSGDLKVYPEKAILDSKKVLMLGLPKLFCKVRLGKGLQETSIDRRNSLEPIWQQELSFRRTTENQIKIELCDQFVIGPAIIGECFINLDLVFAQRNVTVSSQLHKKGDSVGTIQVRLKWEPDNILSVMQPSGNPFASNSTNPFNSSYTNSFNNNNPFATNSSNPFASNNVHNQNNNIMYAPPGTNMTMTFAQNGTQFTQTQNSQQYQNIPQQQPTFSLQQGPVFQPMNIPINSEGPSAQQINVNNPFNQNSGTVIIQPQEEIKEPEEPEDPNLPDEQKCVVCLDKKKAGAFYRCGHNCCCVSCGRKFIGSPCPICRQVVLDFIKVYDT